MKFEPKSRFYITVGVISLVCILLSFLGLTEAGEHFFERLPRQDHAAEFSSNSMVYNSDYFCRSLQSEGVVVDMNVSSLHLGMHKSILHVLYFPPPRSNSFLIIPSKSGNHNWRGLFYRLWVGRAPVDYISDVNPVTAKYEVVKTDRLLNLDQQVWLVARNPYVRLLSVYMEKIKEGCELKATKKKSNGTDIYSENFITREFFKFRNYGNISFEQYVIALTNHIIFDDNRGSPTLSEKFMRLWIKSEGSFNVNDFTAGRLPVASTTISGDKRVKYEAPFLPKKLPRPPKPCANWPKELILSMVDPTGRVRTLDFPDAAAVSPVERAYRLCTTDHHNCVQAAGLLKQQPGRVKLLRLEEQPRWYPQFLRCFGITKNEVVGEEWQQFSGKGCFYSPTDNCTDALTAQNISKLISGDVHGHGTVDLMLQYYTPLAANLAYYLYEYDFLHLGYKRWDGVSPFVV